VQNIFEVFRRGFFGAKTLTAGVQDSKTAEPKKPVFTASTNKKSVVYHGELIVSTTVD
jgi:hypothetical protein